MVELSSLDVRALALELRALEEAYVDKVYQVGPDSFVIKLRHAQHGPAHLVVRPGRFVARAREAPPTPETPTTVALTLRKHLSGARIRRIDQHEFDRVLRIQLERRGEPLELVVELFGKGNLILAGPDGRILMALRTETFAHRTIKRGEQLVLPPPRVNPATLTRSAFEGLAQRADKDAVRFLALDVALGGDLAEELVHRAGVDKNRSASALDVAEMDRLWRALRDVLDQPVHPAVATNAKGFQLETVPFQAPQFRDATREPTPTVSDALLRLADLESERTGPGPDVEFQRLERQIHHQERGLARLRQEADEWERRGHLLFAHYADGALALQKSKATLEARGWETLREQWDAKAWEPDSWMRLLAGVDPKRAHVVIRLEGQEIPLDPLQTLEQNATVLYDESKRIRSKAENAAQALENTRRSLAERAARAQAAPAKPTGPRAPAKRFWFEAHRWFYSTEGFLVVAGRDASANEKLVKRHLNHGDRYVHADVHGAASVIVKGEGRTPGPATMRQACQFAATSSKAFAQFATADAYWVLPEQVSKTAETGMYLPKGSFMVRGARNYEGKLKLELALGMVRLDAQGRPGGPEASHRRLLAGPPEAVEHYTKRVAVVERGDLKPSDAAKQLAPLFGVSLDEVVASLPPGTVRVVRAPEGPA